MFLYFSFKIVFSNFWRIGWAIISGPTSIKLIQKLNKFEELPSDLKEVAILRLENPDVSLKVLGELLENPIGKSGVNHRLKRIHEFAEELREGN